MKKNIKKILCATLCLSTLTITSASAAANRDIGNFYGFELPAYQKVVQTIARYKTKTNAPWAINLTKSKNVNSVHTYLVNSNGEKRSDYAIVGITRTEIESSGQASYYYSAKLMNDTVSGNSGYIYGTWSPDNKQY